MADHEDERLLTIADLEDYLSVGGRTLRRLVAAGKLPAIRVSERHLRFRRADVAAYLERARTETGGGR